MNTIPHHTLLPILFLYFSHCLSTPHAEVPPETKISKQDPIYTPDWASLDSRPNPTWYDQSKIGIFIHWGVYSVPATSSEWFWYSWITDRCGACLEYMSRNHKPNFTYQEFAPEFTAQSFNPEDWAELFQKAGAKYVVLTSKHHEGYVLYPSKYSFSWNSMAVGPHRDIVGELASSIRNKTDLRFGLYYSMYEWYNPLWLKDKANGFGTDEYVRTKALPTLVELVESYRPDIVWPDGEWEAPDSYWRSRPFLTWLFNESPVRESVVINDRWGNDTRGAHGGFWTGEDRLNPGILLPHKWENCMTLDKESWGYRKNAKSSDYLSPEELMRTLVETVSCGGNLLVNVGPTKEGIIVPIQQERLLQMGEWLGVNGEGIYGSVPWTYQNDSVTPGVWYTASADGSKVYAHVTRWPGEGAAAAITLGSFQYEAGLKITMLGYNGTLLYGEGSLSGIQVSLPPPDRISSKWAWTIVIQ